ncbi:MAG: hypothetical protein AABW58_04950 [Nanoarchaeota archaeon]
MEKERIVTDRKMAHKNGNNRKRTHPSIGLIGIGKVGAVVVHDLLEKYPNIHLNLTSRDPQTLRHLLPDMAQIEIEGKEVPVHETLERITVFETINGYVISPDQERKTLFDSDIIIVMARDRKGAKQANYFEDRTDEFALNKELIDTVLGPRLEPYSKKEGIVGVLTNPPELTSERLSQVSGIPRNRIVGITNSSTIRFRDAITRVIREDPRYKDKKLDLEEAVVIGEHGPTMVPVYSKGYVGAQSLTEIPGLNSIKIRRRIKNEIKEKPNISQAADVSAKNVYTPAKAVIETIDALLTGREMPMSAYDGECFITNMTHSVISEQTGRILCVTPNSRFLAKGGISSGEKRLYDRSKQVILEKMKQYKLIT